MMTFDRFNRRTHLYLGLFLIPWLTMYGVSSFLLSHPKWFESGKEPGWQLLFEREYSRPLSANSEVREDAARILEDCGLPGAFWTNQSKPGQLEIMRFRFRDHTRLTYFINEHRLRAEHQNQGWQQVITGLHFRGGFIQCYFWNWVWAGLVDLVCVGILIWIASGLYMWWRLARTRFWGALALSGGLLSFLLLLWQL